MAAVPPSIDVNDTKECDLCKQVGTHLCKCKSVWYCSKRCQRILWWSHRSDCMEGRKYLEDISFHVSFIGNGRDIAAGRFSAKASHTVEDVLKVIAPVVGVPLELSSVMLKLVYARSSDIVVTLDPTWLMGATLLSAHGQGLSLQCIIDPMVMLECRDALWSAVAPDTSDVIREAIKDASTGPPVSIHELRNLITSSAQELAGVLEMVGVPSVWVILGYLEPLLKIETQYVVSYELWGSTQTKWSELSVSSEPTPSDSPYLVSFDVSLPININSQTSVVYFRLVIDKGIKGKTPWMILSHNSNSITADRKVSFQYSCQAPTTLNVTNHPIVFVPNRTYATRSTELFMIEPTKSSNTPTKSITNWYRRLHCLPTYNPNSTVHGMVPRVDNNQPRTVADCLPHHTSYRLGC